MGVDIFRTVLLPSARGLLSKGWVGLLWAGARRLPGRVGHHAKRSAGPLSVVATIASWVVLLWVGYALIYLPGVEDLGYSSGVLFEGSPLIIALYLSGTVLTTLGLGDVVAQTDEMRMVVVLEGAAGLGVFTAALGYLPTLYTSVSALRSSSESVADLQATTPDTAVDLLREDAVATLESVRRDVITSRQHLLRFPVLHYFQPPPGQSILVLAEGAAMVWAVARFGFSGEQHRAVRRQSESLELALRRLVDDLATHVGADVDDDDGQAQAREQVEHIRRAVAGLPEAQAETAELDDDTIGELARTNAVLRRYADLHGYPRPGG